MIERTDRIALDFDPTGEWGDSGVRPAAPPTDTSTPSAAESVGDTWQEVERLLERMAQNDPRRRLLELARLRRDRSLAMVVLRQQLPRGVPRP